MNPAKLLILSTISLILLLSSCDFGKSDDTFVLVKDQSCEDFVKNAKAEIQEISCEKFKEIYDSGPFVLIDTRPMTDHKKGYIPGSICIPRGSLEFRIEKTSVWDKENMYVPKRDELIVLYCAKGNRSALATYTLQNLGYTNVRSLEGGWKQWHMHYHDEIASDLPAGTVVAEEEEEGGC
jgi:rhodanese-related sulfurtransferase